MLDDHHAVTQQGVLQGHCHQPISCCCHLQALSAAACGLPNIPTRLRLFVSVNVAVLAACDGLLNDWAPLANLHELHLDNIYPSATSQGASSKYGWIDEFDVGSLDGLPRLHKLHLGFESVGVVDGQMQLIQLQKLPTLRQVHVSSVCKYDSAGERTGMCVYSYVTPCFLSFCCTDAGTSPYAFAAVCYASMCTVFCVRCSQSKLHPRHQHTLVCYSQELSVVSTGDWLGVVFEPPPHLNSLLISCDGPVTWLVPGCAHPTPGPIKSDISMLSMSSNASATSALSLGTSLSGSLSGSVTGLQTGSVSAVISPRSSMTMDRAFTLDRLGSINESEVSWQSVFVTVHYL